MEDVPKVTFLPANLTYEYESGKLPYGEHGKPESLLDIAMHFGFHASCESTRTGITSRPSTLYRARP